jgi:hypothetical protein
MGVDIVQVQSKRLPMARLFLRESRLPVHRKATVTGNPIANLPCGEFDFLQRILPKGIY